MMKPFFYFAFKNKIPKKKIIIPLWTFSSLGTFGFKKTDFFLASNMANLVSRFASKFTLDALLEQKTDWSVNVLSWLLQQSCCFIWGLYFVLRLKWTLDICSRFCIKIESSSNTFGLYCMYVYMYHNILCYMVNVCFWCACMLACEFECWLPYEMGKLTERIK